MSEQEKDLRVELRITAPNLGKQYLLIQEGQAASLLLMLYRAALEGTLEEVREFRLRLAHLTGKTISETAKDLGVSRRTILNWRKKLGLFSGNAKKENAPIKGTSPSSFGVQYTLFEEYEREKPSKRDDR